jgi:hypothetical protein
MQQLIELRLGSATEKADGKSNDYTINGFQTVLYTLDQMPRLATLVMQLPHVKILNINLKWHHQTWDYDKKEVDARGAQFIV